MEVAPMQKRKYKTKSTCPVDDDGEAGPSQEANAEPEIITESLWYNNLRSLWVDFIHPPNEPILAWMIRVWDSTGDAINLDGGETRFVRSIAQDVCIKEAFVRESKPLSLWAQLLDGVRERFVYRDSLQARHYAKGWKTIEERILRLREMALLEAEEQQVPIATTIVHRGWYRMNRDSVIPIHKMIHELEGQGVINRIHSPFNSPIWPRFFSTTNKHLVGYFQHPGILEIITNWLEGENFSLADEEEGEQVVQAEEGPAYNQLPEEDIRYTLFTDGSCCTVGMKRKWKATVWSPTRQVAEATEGEGESSQFAELKAVQLALDIAE
ncbi:hypothetical protein BTVI_45346 [Pitangus sulphuratus]|nr:hypothetical protein BTVI_45346 [Pitangus sulphuratus]